MTILVHLLGQLPPFATSTLRVMCSEHAGDESLGGRERVTATSQLSGVPTFI